MKPYELIRTAMNLSEQIGDYKKADFFATEGLKLAQINNYELTPEYVTKLKQEILSLKSQNENLTSSLLETQNKLSQVPKWFNMSQNVPGAYNAFPQPGTMMNIRVPDGNVTNIDMTQEDSFGVPMEVR